MANEDILTRMDESGVLTVTLNRPQTKNAFDPRMQQRLVQIFSEAARDPGVRVVVLTGAGDAFCAGADVRSLGGPDPDDPIAQRWAEEPVWMAAEARTERLQRVALSSLLLSRMGKPTVAMVRGAAAGAGMSLALACDFRILSETAFFLTAFAKIGTCGDFGGSYFMTKLIGPSRTKELYMLGDRIPAQQAFLLGLANRVVPDASLETETAALAQRLARAAPIALRYVKENVQAALDESIERAFDVEARNMIRTRLTQDAQDAAKAFLEKREPVFRGV